MRAEPCRPVKNPFPDELAALGSCRAFFDPISTTIFAWLPDFAGKDFRAICAPFLRCGSLFARKT
jgi:hypothetical protein